jgi:hypothetical protein
MAELTRERREELRDAANYSSYGYDFPNDSGLTRDDLRALLDAADERDRLREAGDAVLGSFGPDEERWFTDEMREALNKLALLVLPEDGDAL